MWHVQHFLGGVSLASLLAGRFFFIRRRILPPFQRMSGARVASGSCRWPTICFFLALRGQALAGWDNKPLEYHPQAHPQRFLKLMHLMTAERGADGRSAFALFPLRSTVVPRHIRFDQRALRDLLKLGRSEHTIEAAQAGGASGRRKRAAQDGHRSCRPGRAATY